MGLKQKMQRKKKSPGRRLSTTRSYRYTTGKGITRATVPRLLACLLAQLMGQEAYYSLSARVHGQGEQHVTCIATTRLSEGRLGASRKDARLWNRNE